MEADWLPDKAQFCWRQTGYLTRHSSAGGRLVTWQGTVLLEADWLPDKAQFCWRKTGYLTRHSSDGGWLVTWQGTVVVEADWLPDKALSSIRWAGHVQKWPNGNVPSKSHICMHSPTPTFKHTHTFYLTSTNISQIFKFRLQENISAKASIPKTGQRVFIFISLKAIRLVLGRKQSWESPDPITTDLRYIW